MMSAITAEMARRQPEGGWLYVIDLYVIDHPFASLEPEELVALTAAMEADSGGAA